MSNQQQGGAAAPRTLADDLRARDDTALAALLRARPDLLSPVPNDLTQLATRAGTRASVVRAVERLDRFALQVADALAVAPDPCSVGTLRGLLTGWDGGAREAVAARLPHALAALRARALVWGGDDRLRLVRTAREVLAPTPGGPSPTGLGPTLAEASAGMSPGRLQEILRAAGLPPTHDPVSALAALAGLFTDPERLDTLLAGAPPGAHRAEAAEPEPAPGGADHSVLGRLTWGPPYGTVDPAAPSPPVGWLLARGLLLPAGERTVVLPREVALHLRRGRAHRKVAPEPPDLEVQRTHPVETVDGTAGGQAFAALATVEELLGVWEAEPPSVLRAGGLGVRDLKRTAVALDLPEPTTAFWIELAYAAGLLAPDGEPDESYAPTPAYDDWRRRPPEARWAGLVSAWLPATRVAGLVGERDAKGRSLSALDPGLDRGLAADVRHRTLALLASLPEGAAPTRDGVMDRLAWERPLRGSAPADASAGAVTGTVAGAVAGASPARRRGDAPTQHDLRSRLAAWTLAEAELLGLTGRGALARHARLLCPAEPGAVPWGRVLTRVELDRAVREAARRLAALLPEPVDHILLQADLTAVAPGPLARELATQLSAVADVESKGGATVYRFTPGSVRRGLDAGLSAADVHALLVTHSRTPVPQPLSYLVDDVARRHGRLRVGVASSYLRCDDDALLAEILADRRSAPLRLRLLAPTVLASPAPPDQLLGRLREMGYAPAAEGAEGDVLVARADAPRTPPRTPPEPVPDGPPVPDAGLLSAAVRAVRAGDHAATAAHKPKIPAAARAGSAGGPLPRSASAETLATVQAAALAGTAVWIGYVNADGAASQRVIAPVRVEGGFVTAYDHTADEVRTYPLHRITGVAELAEE